MALKLKLINLFKTLLIFSFALMLLSGCEVAWFGDIKTDIESDLTSTFRFYAQTQETDPEAQVVELTYNISEEVDSSEFPEEEIEIVKAGYHINYWHFYRDSNTKDTQVPSSVYLDSTITDKVSSIKVTPQMFDFYAVWAPNTDTKYKVEHYFQNLTLDGYDVDAEKTQQLTGTTDELTNAKSYTVEGFTAKEIIQVNIDGDESAVVKVYYDRVKSVVIVDQGDGSEPIEYKGYYGQTVTGAAPADRTNTGYEFSQWNITLEDGTTDTSKETEVIFLAQESTYTAEWKEIKYTITWELLPQGGKVTPVWAGNYKPVETYTVTTGCTLPGTAEISRTGANFQGWYTDKDFTSPASSWTNGQLGNKTFYAKWNLITYTITYDSNGGSIVSVPASYTVEDTVVLATSAKSGWYFKGWYTNASLTGTALTSWTPGNITGNLDLYAKWSEQTTEISGITITFPSSNDEELNLSVTYDMSTKRLTYSAAAGYSSYAWYYDGNLSAGITGSSGIVQINSLTIGYHSLLLVVTDSSGNQYSAEAELQVKGQ